MAAQTAFAENCQTRLVLEPWRFARAAWLVAPTVGSPPASPAGCLSSVALHFAVFLRLTTGSALELAPMGSAFPSMPMWLSPVAMHLAVFLRLTTGSALELAPMGSAFPSTRGCLSGVGLQFAVFPRRATGSPPGLVSVWRG